MSIRRNRPASPRPTRLLATLACGVCVALGAAACNMIDAELGRHASISRMVPGYGLTGGDQLDCWLTLEFKHYPEGGLRDVEVRFQSIALAESASFDWAYIAEHDKLARERTNGVGYREAEMTNAGKPPPLGQPTRIMFPLRAKPVITNAPETLYLEAELYWDGIRQDTIRRTIDHIYDRVGG